MRSMRKSGYRNLEGYPGMGCFEINDSGASGKDEFLRIRGKTYFEGGKDSG